MTNKHADSLMLLRGPTPPVTAFVRPALLYAAVFSCVAAVIVQGIRVWLFGDLLDVVSGLELTAGLFVAIFPLRLIYLHRKLMDVAFTWVGFGATFFGLAMLLVFFTRLGFEVANWFAETPGLVRAQNDIQLKRVEDAKNIMQESLAGVQKEMNEALATAATPEEKAEIQALFNGRKDAAGKIVEKGIFDMKKEDFKQLALEAETAAKNVRQDTSSLGVLGHFLTNGPSNQPQDAGIWPAILGSIWVTGITAFFAVPIGVGAAIYLEEYKRRKGWLGWLGQVIQININNLAGVPSVVYGILGGFVFVWIFSHLEQWDPTIAARNVLGGGLTLMLLTLPVVIVSAQEAIRAVPSSIRQGAYALGATKWQVIWHQVLPMSSPGILTGTILSISRAIGEAAPLVLFGALLFVDQTPWWNTRFTVLPMQIFGWSDRPDEIWRYNAALASVVLLVMLLVLNAVAIFMRSRAVKRARS